eukprot:6198941-Pleurochrysis_carterae.AAC.1
MMGRSPTSSSTLRYRLAKKQNGFAVSWALLSQCGKRQLRYMRRRTPGKLSQSETAAQNSPALATRMHKKRLSQDVQPKMDLSRRTLNAKMTIHQNYCCLNNSVNRQHRMEPALQLLNLELDTSGRKLRVFYRTVTQNLDEILPNCGAGQPTCFRDSRI